MTARPARTPAPPGPQTRPGGTEAGRGRYHHGDLANALTEAAVALAREGGPDAVVLREAARRVGVSPAAAYRHFAAHDDLVYAVKLQAQRELTAAMLAGLEGLPPQADPVAEATRRMNAIGRGYLRFALDEPGLFRSAFCHAEPTAPDAAGAPNHDEPHSVEYLQRYLAFQILSETLDRLAEVGLLPPERRPNAEIPAWASVHGLATLLLDGTLGLEDESEREAVLELTVDTFIGGLIR